MLTEQVGQRTCKFLLRGFATLICSCARSTLPNARVHPSFQGGPMGDNVRRCYGVFNTRHAHRLYYCLWSLGPERVVVPWSQNWSQNHDRGSQYQVGFVDKVNFLAFVDQ